jgi:hypothetical protein
MPQQIPLTNLPSSVFEITLVDGRLLTLQTKFNVRGANDTRPYWTLDIYEGGAPLKLGLALVLGVDLIRQFNLGIGSLVMADITDNYQDATKDTLGTTVVLLHYAPGELENG